MRGGIHQKIVTVLYEDIIPGVLGFGNKLAEEHLAEKFGVKRHTIREAFLHLEGRASAVTWTTRGWNARRTRSGGIAFTGGIEGSPAAGCGGGAVP